MQNIDNVRNDESNANNSLSREKRKMKLEEIYTVLRKKKEK